MFSLRRSLKDICYCGSQQTLIRIHPKPFKHISCYQASCIWTSIENKNAILPTTKKRLVNNRRECLISKYAFQCQATMLFSKTKNNLLTVYKNKQLDDSIISQHTSRLFTTASTTLFCSSKEKSDNTKQNANWLTVPNILTMGRLIVSPYIGYLVLCEQFTWAFALVFLAGLTDMLDGWIARNFKDQASNIGSYIDPLADKVLISILTLSLTVVNVIPIALCGLIISRDVLLVGTSSHFHYKHLEPPKTIEKFFDFENSKVKMEPTLISKFNTFLQLGLVGISVAAPVFHFMEHPLLHAYWYLVASTTVISGLSYVVKDKSAYVIK